MRKPIGSTTVSHNGLTFDVFFEVESTFTPGEAATYDTPASGDCIEIRTVKIVECFVIDDAGRQIGIDFATDAEFVVDIETLIWESSDEWISSVE